MRARDGSETELSAEYILVATGSRPAHPANVPFDGTRIYDSDTILHLDSIPASLIVVGGGVIGSEYATLFGAMGLRVTLVDAGARLLPFLDSELCDVLARQMQECGVTVRCRIQTSAIAVDDDAAGRERRR